MCGIFFCVIKIFILTRSIKLINEIIGIIVNPACDFEFIEEAKNTENWKKCKTLFPHFPLHIYRHFLFKNFVRYYFGYNFFYVPYFCLFSLYFYISLKFFFFLFTLHLQQSACYSVFLLWISNLIFHLSVSNCHRIFGALQYRENFFFMFQQAIHIDTNSFKIFF